MSTRQPSTASRTVGVIGLGQMGRGIALNLDKKERLAALWDVRPESANGFSSAVAFAPPNRMAEQCEVVIFVVPSSKEIEACLSGPQGLLAADRRGQVIIDLTTSDPQETGRLVKIARDRGRDYLDAGISGGAVGADAGMLTLMFGGDAATLDRCRPMLDAIATRIFHVGPSGAGHTMKLIHNMVCHANFFVLSEAGRLAARAGIDLKPMIDVINAGNARSYISEARFPNHILSGKFDGRSRVANLAKDLGMAADLAADLGRPGVFGPLTASLLDRAMNEGMGERDFTTLYLEMDRLLEAERMARGQSK
ncbi:MAG: NAD(P)-dependent oxidoreductase [Betaproteobacteria bacterium]|nr:NAD(P)-dependent oxidoreductase [Betaproteobacteria bacterium]